MVELDVPLYGQQTFYYCVPASVKMVLEYVGKKHKVKNFPKLSIKRIAKIVKTNRDGTLPTDVENMNEALCKATPSIEFEAKFLGGFPEIREQLRPPKENPVIAWVNCVEPPDILLHAIVVTGFDSETNTVFYNEPDGGVKKKMEVGVFIKKWGNSARMVKVLIGRVTQRKIYEWSADSIDDGETSD